MLAEEAEWFRSAARNASTRERVPGGVRWNDKHGVLVRQYIHGKPGGWAQEGRLSVLHNELEAKMLPWTAPEFKGDSYVLAPKRGGRRGAERAVLVDASMPQRVGQTLVRYALDVAAGKRKTNERLADIAYLRLP